MTPAQVKDWIDLVLRPIHLLAVALMALFLIVVPGEWAGMLGLSEFLKSHRDWVGLGLIASVGLLAARLLTAVGHRVRRWSVARGRKNRLSKLSAPEKTLLRMYIDGNTKTQVLPIGDGVVAGLVHQMILYRASSVSVEYTDFAYNMQLWAWEHLQNHPELLK